MIRTTLRAAVLPRQGLAGAQPTVLDGLGPSLTSVGTASSVGNASTAYGVEEDVSTPGLDPAGAAPRELQ